MNLHEVECVELSLPSPRPVKELLVVFKSLGFILHDDVVSLDRRGKFPPWQHPSIVEVEVRFGGEEIFGFEEGEWDVVRLKYLFATTPYEFSEKFMETAFDLGQLLSAHVTWRDEIVDASSLKDHFARIRVELFEQTGEDPGSEGLAILIQGKYPRR